MQIDKKVKETIKFSLAIFASFLFYGTAAAMPPRPITQDGPIAGKSSTEIIKPDVSSWHERGICTPDDFGFKYVIDQRSSANASSSAASFRILAILVGFSDNPASVTTTFFDTLVFGLTGTTVHDYFDEISGAQIDLVTLNLPSSIGWNTAPQTYSYYVNGEYGTGSYPNNSQKLVEDLVDLVDPVVDFSNYDNDNNGTVDILLIIHAGSGAEFTSSTNDIWSHKWQISPRVKDGVSISSYTVQPEFWSTPGDMTIGVYSHELCHGLGLPDLYDTDNSSNGIGRWGIMATGSWNGPSGLGGSPAYPCAWSRIKMGVATSTNVTSNLTAEPLDAIESGGQIYRLWTSGSIGSEYYLVENRQKIGYDSYLVGSGLLIWHIDDAKTNNTKEWYPTLPGSEHYLVALVQADGLYELEHKVDLGDANDPFPGGSNWFATSTSPTSDTYSGSSSSIEVNNISASSSNMTADLIVGVITGIGDGSSGNLPNTVELDQNYPNPFNPSTIIAFDLPVAGQVQLEIFNVLGQKVRTLFEENAGAGRIEVQWSGNNDQGTIVSSGIYFYKLTTKAGQITKKMAFIR